jgi:hypothetical protein
VAGPGERTVTASERESQQRLRSRWLHRQLHRKLRSWLPSSRRVCLPVPVWREPSHAPIRWLHCWQKKLAAQLAAQSAQKIHRPATRGFTLGPHTAKRQSARPVQGRIYKENLRVGCRKLAIQRQSRLCHISSFLSQRAGKCSPKWREKRKQALRGAELIAKKKGGTKIKTCFIEIASHFEQRVLYCTDGSSNVFNLLTFSTL